MNHDMTHCYGCSTTLEGERIIADSTQPCQKRDTCKRYLASIEAAEMGMTYISYRLGSAEDCNLYWEIYKANNEEDRWKR